MEQFNSLMAEILGGNPAAAFSTILSLVLIESLLSIDNAAVLATMVMDLPDTQRKKALRIGLVLAFVFRGAALVFASILIKINWLKLMGGGYLLYLAIHFFYKYFFKKENILQIEEEELEEEVKHPKKLFGMSQFWSTVLMVEMMDLTFSLDNVFAAVAITNNIYLVYIGVFIGIITMRIVAGYFVKLMEVYPFLDAVAFSIIGLLGIRLIISFFCFYSNGNVFCELAEGELSQKYFSVLTVLIFVTPIFISWLRNRNKQKTA